MEKINLGSILENSVVDGPGLRMVIFTQGCNHGCVGCHNKDSWSLKPKELWDVYELIEYIKKECTTKKITISGGDPFLQNEQVLEICKELKKDRFNIYIYTGFLYEELLKNKINSEILDNIDYLIDGKYIKELHDSSMSIIGSTNQRIINVAEYKKGNHN